MPFDGDPYYNRDFVLILLLINFSFNASSIILSINNIYNLKQQTHNYYEKNLINYTIIFDEIIIIINIITIILWACFFCKYEYAGDDDWVSANELLYSFWKGYFFTLYFGFCNCGSCIFIIIFSIIISIILDEKSYSKNYIITNIFDFIILLNAIRLIIVFIIKFIKYKKKEKRKKKKEKRIIECQK